MTRKTTILLHSSAGVSALVAGLKLVYGSPDNLVSELLRLWPQMRKPGQFVSLENSQQRVICFNSGTAPQIVQMVFDTSTALWGVDHLHAKSVPEGLFCSSRARLLMVFPTQPWLLKSELTVGGAQELWR